MAEGGKLQVPQDKERFGLGYQNTVVSGRQPVLNFFYRAKSVGTGQKQSHYRFDFVYFVGARDCGTRGWEGRGSIGVSRGWGFL